MQRHLDAKSNCIELFHRLGNYFAMGASPRWHIWPKASLCNCYGFQRSFICFSNDNCKFKCHDCNFRSIWNDYFRQSQHRVHLSYGTCSEKLLGHSELRLEYFRRFNLCIGNSLLLENKQQLVLLCLYRILTSNFFCDCNLESSRVSKLFDWNGETRRSQDKFVRDCSHK